jgi:hypothetical protein
MKVAKFVNFSDQPFTGSWNKETETFAAGASKFMPDWLAKHYAKHLVNREILKFPGGETMTSPKRPEDVPVFMELFAKAYIEEDGSSQSDEKVEQEVIDKNERTAPKRASKKKAAAPEAFEGTPDEAL